MIPVIVNSVNNLSDARYAAGMGVDWMGFQVDTEAERYVSPELFKAITSWVAGVQTVAETVILNPETLNRIKIEYQPDFIQFEQLENLTTSDMDGISCIRKFTVTKGQELTFLESFNHNEQYENPYVLIDLSDWSDWRTYKTEIKEFQIPSQTILWALPIEKEDISTINNLHIKGLSLKGGDEQRPGWKDLDEMIDILEALEEN